LRKTQPCDTLPPPYNPPTHFMKLERLTEYVTIVVTVVFGMLLALYIGSSAGNGSSTPALIIGAMLAVMVALILQANVWLLIPLCGPMGGMIVGTPLGLKMSHLAVLYAFGVFLALKALKVVRTKAKYNWLDYLLFFNLFYLLTVYIRNPVGTDSLGFEKIGGKPYVEVIIAMLAYWVINHVNLSSKMAVRMPFILTFGSAFNGLMGIITNYFPQVGVFIGYLYTGFIPRAADVAGEAMYSAEMSRDAVGRNFEPALLMIYSYYPPLSTLNPFFIIRFSVAAFCLIAALVTGFRSVFIEIGVFFIIATFFYSGKRAAFRIPVVIVPLLVLLIAAQGTLIHLPTNIQRTLCFLPGDWDPIAKNDAEGSTEWRIDIWQNVWNSGHKYIKDWWWGDGFGMTKAELRDAQRTFADSKENLTISGDYHSLPLSTIHVVGYVGLVQLLILMFSMACYSWKLILRARRTPFFPIALFVGVPVVYALLFGFLVFGAFSLTCYSNIYSIAWLRLIDRGLERYLMEKKEIAKQPEEAFCQLGLSRFDPTPT